MKYVITALMVILNFSLNGQNPKISGDIFINTELGLIKCDILVENVPTMKDYCFALHKGMNLQFIKANEKSKSYSTDFGIHLLNANLYNGIGYAPNIDSVTEDTNFKISYIGAFPVYDDNINNQDHADSQVEIVFKNNVLRAAYNSLWYPLLFDRITKKLVSSYTYELNIRTDRSSQSIYISGCPPQAGSPHYFASNIPRRLFLYVGDYSFSSNDEVHFLNSSLTKEQQKGISETFSEINNYYYSILDVRFPSKLVLGQLFSKGPEDQYDEWAIAEYPVILADLGKLPFYLSSKSNQIEDLKMYKIYAHELAHQYWSGEINTESTCWTFLYSESFAEYFALKTLAAQKSKESYMEFISKAYFHEDALLKKFTPLSQLNDSSFRSVNPYYSYYPMLFIGLEQVVGEQKVLNFFRYILNDKDKQSINYEYLENAALKSGLSIEEWNTFEKEYVSSENCLQIVLERMK